MQCSTGRLRHRHLHTHAPYTGLVIRVVPGPSQMGDCLCHRPKPHPLPIGLLQFSPPQEDKGQLQVEISTELLLTEKHVTAASSSKSRGRGPSPRCPSGIGRSLSSRWRNWAGVWADQWTVQVLKEGYRVSFNGPTPPLELGLETSSLHPKEEAHQRALEGEIQDLLLKRAIQEVPPNLPGFFSRLFLVERASGFWRPVIDLSALNRFVARTTFKMETTRTVLAAIREGDFMLSLDLKDPYFQIPVHPSSRRFLRFMVQRKVVRAEGGVSDLQHGTGGSVQLGEVTTLPNHEDGESWDGDILRAIQGFPDKGEGRESGKHGKALHQGKLASLKEWQRLLGHLVSLEKLSTKEALQWWLEPKNNQARVSLLDPPPEILLFKDASRKAWGAHLPDKTAGGLRSSEEKTLHINELKLWALVTLGSSLVGRRVPLISDNATVFAYVKKQGGLRSLRIHNLTGNILSWDEDNAISLTARYIPGKMNAVEDGLSRRGQVLHGEWSLHPKVARAVIEKWGSPCLDLCNKAEHKAASLLFPSARPSISSGRRISTSVGQPRRVRLPSIFTSKTELKPSSGGEAG
ncbi:uncharacterized protein [Palaemon carinicauda]|uniref:uncharacterized protein n=1 Tax=Palaemon carinicauda TaxID=392227 RepID=UPI0035B59AD5